MHERRKIAWVTGVLAVVFALNPFLLGAEHKPHTVVLGTARKVAYSRAGDPAGALPAEDSLRIRALLVDGGLKEWTTGEAHDVTDRSFVIRRALRLNDDLPGDRSHPSEKQSHWVWQRGPWLLVDRVSGHISPLKLPDYDPAVSQVSWFRDYAAYCGVTPSGKSLYAIVSQLAVRKPVLAKKLAAFSSDLRGELDRVCTGPEWQREPLRVTFRPTGKDPVSFDIAPGSAVLVEDASDEPETAPSSRP